MSRQRIDLNIKIAGLEPEPAEVLASLKPSELIAEILREFQADLLHLSNRPEDYMLCPENSTLPLEEYPLLRLNLTHNALLVLALRPTELPSGAQFLSPVAQLREQSSGTVYHLYWQPAIIGRSDTKKGDNALLAVNLQSYPNGQKVSRRHVRLTQKKGEFFIESLSDTNQTTLVKATGEELVLSQQPQLLENKDCILLNKSGIRLLFLNG
jgi:FHA domain